jgi:hypothetical protein
MVFPHVNGRARMGDDYTGWRSCIFQLALAVNLAFSTVASVVSPA